MVSVQAVRQRETSLSLGEQSKPQKRAREAPYEQAVWTAMRDLWPEDSRLEGELGPRTCPLPLLALSHPLPPLFTSQELQGASVPPGQHISLQLSLMGLLDNTLCQLFQCFQDGCSSSSYRSSYYLCKQGGMVDSSGHKERASSFTCILIRVGKATVLQ